MVIRPDYLGSPDAYRDVTSQVAFGSSRSVGSETTFVWGVVQLASDGTAAEVAVDLNGTQLATLQHTVDSGGLTSTPNITTDKIVPLFVPPEASYTLRNVTDPLGENAIEAVRELRF